MKTLLIFFLLISNLISAQNQLVELNLAIDSAYRRPLAKHEVKRLKKDLGYRIDANNPTIEQFDVTLTISNRSENPVNFWLMSCSYEDNFWVNNNYISIQNHECDKNIPESVSINPSQHLDYKFTLIKSLKLDYPFKYCLDGEQVKTTKLGLIFIDANIFLGCEMDMSDKSKWDIIWSNPLELLNCNK